MPARMSIASTTSQTWFGVGIMAVASEGRTTTAHSWPVVRCTSRRDCAVAPCCLPQELGRQGGSVPESRGLSPPLSLPCPCDASDKTLSLPIHDLRSTLSASGRFDAMHQDAHARIPPRVASPLAVPSEKRQACMGLAPAYRWVRRSLTNNCRSDQGGQIGIDALNAYFGKNGCQCRKYGGQNCPIEPAG